MRHIRHAAKKLKPRNSPRLHVAFIDFSQAYDTVPRQQLDGLGKLKEHAPRSEHVHLHQDIGHIRKNHLHATLLHQLSKYAHASGIYLYCA